MKVVIPDGLIAVATKFSKFKTPEKRTQGWEEQKGEVRGEGDMLDTIGSLMLWRFLVERDVPTTYLLTGRQGDDADLQIKYQPESEPMRILNVNVKTSKFEWKKDDNLYHRGHSAIKKVEFEKSIFDIYAQVFVHLKPFEQDDPPHVHLCGWIGCKDKAFKTQKETVIPNTGGERGYWMPLKNLRPTKDLPERVLRSRKGDSQETVEK